MKYLKTYENNNHLWIVQYFFTDNYDISLTLLKDEQSCKDYIIDNINAELYEDHQNDNELEGNYDPFLDYDEAIKEYSLYYDNIKINYFPLNEPFSFRISDKWEIMKQENKYNL